MIPWVISIYRARKLITHGQSELMHRRPIDARLPYVCQVGEMNYLRMIKDDAQMIHRRKDALYFSRM